MTNKVYNNRMRRLLLDKINDFTSTEHEEIFKIIKEFYNNDCTYTENSNGIFFNMNTFPNNLLIKIENFVIFCNDNNKKLDEYDKKLKECKLSSSKEIENHDNKNDVIMVLNNDNKDTDNIHINHICLKSDNQDLKNEQIWKSIVENDTNLLKTIHHLYSHDKCYKKKIYTKFHAAKKRFSKIVPLDRRSYSDVNNELEKSI
jgi:hypothetical protein